MEHEWEKEFEKVLPEAMHYYNGELVSISKSHIKDFIRAEKEKSYEEGYREGQDWNRAYGEGYLQALHSVQEQIDALKGIVVTLDYKHVEKILTNLKTTHEKN